VKELVSKALERQIEVALSITKTTPQDPREKSRVQALQHLRAKKSEQRGKAEL